MGESVLEHCMANHHVTHMLGSPRHCSLALTFANLVESWQARDEDPCRREAFSCLQINEPRLLRCLLEECPASRQCGKSMYTASQILGRQGPESRRSEWSLKPEAGVSFPLCSVTGVPKGRRWRVGKSRMQTYMFRAKKLEAQSATLSRPRQRLILHFNLFPMVLSLNDLPP